MTTEYPDYYGKFRCIAARCPKTCCAGWEIGIDEETYYFYQTLTGKTREKLDRYLKENEDGFSFELTEKGRCPFLNDRNLCDLYAEFGERGISITCREHPRFITECGDYRQIDISLSCPEAARLFFENSSLPEILFSEELFPAEELDGYEKAFRVSLLSKRNRRLSDIGEAESLYGLIKQWFSEEGTEIENESIMIEDFLSLQEVREDPWKEMVIGRVKETDIRELLSRHEEWSRKLVFYFLFRYSMDEFFSSSSETPVLTALRGTVLILLLSEELEKQEGFEKEALTLAARKFSSEIEYSEKNIGLIGKKKPSGISE